LERLILDKLIKNNEKIMFAESMTGGRITAKLVEVEGASRAVLGGIVSYNESIKKALLDVDSKTITEDSVVSSSVALQMARGLFKYGATIGVSITGNASKNTQKNSESFVAYIAIATKEKEVVRYLKFLSKNRKRNIKYATKVVFETLYQFLD
jgi:nicotinamide-nucleotide amidase